MTTEPIRFLSKSTEFFEFSNFFEVSPAIELPLRDGGEPLPFPTTEHYFQAMKFAESSPEHAEAIRCADTPAKAKKLGMSHAHPIRPDWDEARIEVMRVALAAKFRNRRLRNLLLSTGDRELIEANTKDGFWGAGDGTGKNVLGHLLMELRESLRKN